MKICGIFCGCNHFVTTISCVRNIEYRGMLFLSSPSFPIHRFSRNYFSPEIPQGCKLPVGIDYARRDNRSATRQRKRAGRTVGASSARPLSCAAPRRDRLCPKGQSIRRPAAEKGSMHRRGEQCSPAGSPHGFACRRMHSFRMPGRRGRRPLRRERAGRTVGASSARPLSCAAPRRDRLCPKGQSIRRPQGGTRRKKPRP